MVSDVNSMIWRNGRPTKTANDERREVISSNSNQSPSMEYRKDCEDNSADHCCWKRRVVAIKLEVKARGFGIGHGEEKGK